MLGSAEIVEATALGVTELENLDRTPVAMRNVASVASTDSDMNTTNGSSLYRN